MVAVSVQNVIVRCPIMEYSSDYCRIPYTSQVSIDLYQVPKNGVSASSILLSFGQSTTYNHKKNSTTYRVLTGGGGGGRGVELLV